MPESITIDITPLREFGDAVRVGEIELEGDVDILRDDDDLLVTVQQPRIEEEETVVDEELEGEELAEGEEGAEGEAAAAQESDEE